MVGPVPAREDEAARLTGARGDFVSSLAGRVEALRVSLRAVEQSPGDTALRNGLLRRIHALSSAARVLGFASVAEALTETEKRLRKSEFSDVARSLDLLPSLLMGAPESSRPARDVRNERASTSWPLSVLIFGAQSLADVISAIPGTHVECERTEDLVRAREQARLFGPDLAVIDADRPGARELIETFAKDLRVDPVPLVVVGDFLTPEAASSFLALGAARVLSKPVNPEALQRTVIDLRALAAEPRAAREPLGELSVEALAERIAVEVRRGLLESVTTNSRSTSVGFGDGADVMAAVWGAVARVRELITLRSNGAVRFDSSGPEGAVPISAWGSDERRAGERGAGASEVRSGEGVSLQGRRIVVADDDPAVVWFISGLLKALGVEVLEAHDGARALTLTYDTWPDLVVSDVLMPKLDGFSLCHEIKRDVAVRDVPVILLSWKEDLLQRVRELGANADGYLRKEAAASTVAERVREVLRSRASVEQRIAAGGDVRGRLDGLTPRLILELAARGNGDVRVGIRDAVYLYEVQVRQGRLCSATRSSVDGRFERGDDVLAALLGVSAGRFSVEPDATPCRVDFEGSVAQVLKAPIEQARRALRSISAAALVGVTRVHVTRPILEGYLACTPEPALGLLEKIIAGSSPRELVTSGAVAPHLLEAVLSDIARRGAVSGIDREGSALELAPAPPPLLGEQLHTAASSLRAVPAAPVLIAPSPGIPEAAAPDISAEDAGWFSLQVESSAEPAGVLPSPAISGQPHTLDSYSAALPFNREVTPAVERAWEKITEGVFSGPGTLQGVGLPSVSTGVSKPVAALPPAVLTSTAAVEPPPVPSNSTPRASDPIPRQPSSPEELDVLASALTGESPSPAPVAREAAQTHASTGTGVSATESAFATAAVAPESIPVARSRPAPASSRGEPQAISAPPSGVSALKASLRPPAPPPVTNADPGWLLRLLLVAGLAFGVAYALVTFFRMQSAPGPSQHTPSRTPATP